MLLCDIDSNHMSKYIQHITLLQLIRKQEKNKKQHLSTTKQTFVINSFASSSFIGRISFELHGTHFFAAKSVKATKGKKQGQALISSPLFKLVE